MAILADVKKIHNLVDLQGVVQVALSLKGCCFLVALVGNQILLPLDHFCPKCLSVLYRLFMGSNKKMTNFLFYWAILVSFFMCLG